MTSSTATVSCHWPSITSPMARRSAPAHAPAFLKLSSTLSPPINRALLRPSFSNWAANAFVLPSRDEPLGNALIEAWRVGLPTVATETDGPNWYAKDHRDTLLVPINDPISIANALQRLKGNLNLRSQLVTGANRTLSELFDRDAVIGAYLALFDRVHQTRKAIG